MQAGLLIVYPNRVVLYGGGLVNSSLQRGNDYDKMKKRYHPATRFFMYGRKKQDFFSAIECRKS